MNGSSLITSKQEPAGRGLLPYHREIANLAEGSVQPVVEVNRQSVYLTAKRLFDLSAALLALIGLAPVFLATALLIKLRDGGPILFIQKRIGKDGKVFDFYKFRSMVVGAERMRAELDAHNQHRSGVTFKMKDDPRITWIGRIIRRSSIDELPQFLNILRGDMSFVGPRPPIPMEVAKYSEQDYRRLSVVPGLTCYWQIQGRAELPFDEQVKLDIAYIEKQSFKIDLEILARTLPAVLSGRGAY